MQSVCSFQDSQAFIPRLIDQSKNQTVWNIFSVFLGVALLSALAQINFTLPWTPVPVTGQTFGVTLVALLWGAKRGASTVFAYLSLGGLGAPVFALAKSGFLPLTFGYLVGMFFSALLIGTLADKGCAQSWMKAALCGFCGSFCVLSCGLIGMSFHMPLEKAFMLGVLPFLAGDVVKTCTAAFIASRFRQN